MTSMIQNYGFTKTIVKDNNGKSKNEIQWVGDYDGNIANIDIDFDNNGNKDVIHMQLDNNDLRDLLGIQPINTPIEQRLVNDFLDESYRPMFLDNNMIIQTSHKNKSTKKHKRGHKHKNSHKHRRGHKYISTSYKHRTKN